MSAPPALPAWASPAVIAARRPAALRRDWEPRALCRGLPPADAADLFFPTRAAHRGENTQAAAYRATVNDWCARCPVNTDCVAANITEQDGVFGSTPDQRRVLRRDLARAGVHLDAPRTDPRAGIPRSASGVRQAKRRASG